LTLEIGAADHDVIDFTDLDLHGAL
jgi:hypothetical protein